MCSTSNNVSAQIFRGRDARLHRWCRTQCPEPAASPPASGASPVLPGGSARSALLVRWRLDRRPAAVPLTNVAGSRTVERRPRRPLPTAPTPVNPTERRAPRPSGCPHDHTQAPIRCSAEVQNIHRTESGPQCNPDNVRAIPFGSATAARWGWRLSPSGQSIALTPAGIRPGA
jgi:hypothetical protein